MPLLPPVTTAVAPLAASGNASTTSCAVVAKPNSSPAAIGLRSTGNDTEDDEDKEETEKKPARRKKNGMLGSTEFSCRRTTSTSTSTNRSSIHRFVPTGRYIRKQSAWKRGFASFSSTMSTTRPKASGADHGTSPRSAQLKGVYLLPDGKLMEKMPLSAVVSDAVRRWYVETEREANRGDVKAMALLGQMLMEGYGCDVDIDLGKKWADKARRRGYRMQRVYCEI